MEQFNSWLSLMTVFRNFFFFLLNKIKYSYKTRKITYLIINFVKKDNPKGYTPADGLPVPMKKYLKPSITKEMNRSEVQKIRQQFTVKEIGRTSENSHLTILLT